MKQIAPFALAAFFAGSGLALTACILDLTDLTNGHRDGGDGGAGGSSASVTASSASSTSGQGGASSSSASSSASSATASSTTATSSSSASATVTSSSGTGGSDPGCGSTVLDCSGCACPAGGCTAVPLATGTTAAGALAITVSPSDGLFWVNTAGNKIWHIPARGSAPVVLTNTVSAPTAIAVVAGQAVYAANLGIYTCKVDTCMSTQALIVPASQGAIQNVAFDGTLIFWTDRGASETTGLVRRCTLGACSKPDTIVAGQLAPFGLVVANGYLYWTVQGDGNTNGAVRKVSRTGLTGDIKEISGGLMFPTRITADESNVYWTQGNNGKILRCAHTGNYCNMPVEVASTSNTGTQGDIVAMDGRIFWNDTPAGQLLSCPAPGCSGSETPLVHASGRSNIHHIAVSSSCLFWTDNVGNGSVAKMGR